MTRQCVPNELYGQLHRKFRELERRIDQGTIPFQRAINDLQALIEGRTFDSRIIDCDADPFVPEGWTVAEHRERGQLKWNPDMVSLYLSDSQKDNKTIRGHELRKELENQLVLNANVLDYLLNHQGLIPETWKGKQIFFWGTIYHDQDGSLCVRCLYWVGGRWDGDYRWLDNDLGVRSFAAFACK